MHNLPELIDRCKIITLNNLEKLEISVLEALESSSSTVYVKTLQSISLQKSIFLIGSISIYESILQETLKCNNGFDEVKKILNKNNDYELLKRFEEVIYIINILKHGKGRS